MRGTFGVLLIAGGVLLAYLIIRSLVNVSVPSAGGLSTANVGGGPTAPHVPGLVVQTGLIGTNSPIMHVSTLNVTGSLPPAPRIPGLPVQTGLFGLGQKNP